MSLFKKFIKLMKSELPKKTRFMWTLDEEKYLSIADVRKLLRACKKEREAALKKRKTVPIRDWFMVELGLNTGLRVEEMTNIKCGDFHIKEKNASLSVRKGKGGRPRTVRMNENFKKNCIWFLKWKQRQGQGTDSDSYLLTTNNGRKLSTRALQKAFKRCVKKAGIPGYYSIHALRHTYGTHLYMASNHNLRLVQEQLGHSSVRTTEVYASLVDSDIRKALEKLYK